MTYFLLFCHLCYGIFLAFPFLFFSPEKKKKIIKSWSRKLLEILSIEVSLHDHGGLLKNLNRRFIVSNHISWLDIFVINSISPVIFVAKSDVSKWPLINILANACDTVFINRKSKKSLKKAMNRLGRLSKKSSICIFPEGTSTRGDILLPFHANLFQVSIENNKAVTPLAITYKIDGKFTDIPAFIGKDTLVGSISKIILSKKITANLVFLRPIKTNGQDRRSLAIKSHHAIAKIISSSAPHTPQ